MKNKFLVPIITPFNDDETVNYDALKKLVRRVLDDGADGIYASGSSAECFLLNTEEREKTLEAVIEAADGAYVMAHIGEISGKNAVKLAKHALKAGADSIASVPPFYYKFSIQGVCDYYSALAEIGLPLFVYSMPQNTRALSVDDYVKLAAIKGVSGIKFTDINYFEMQQVIAKTGLEVYSGKDECFLAALSMGAKGAIGTTFNVMLDKYKTVYDRYQKGDMSGALAKQTEANAVTAALLENLLPAVKYLVKLKYGIDCGGSRSPFTPLTPEHKLRLNAIAQNIM